MRDPLAFQHYLDCRVKEYSDWDLWSFSLVSYFHKKITWPIFKAHYKAYKPVSGKNIPVINKITTKDMRTIVKNDPKGQEVVLEVCMGILRFLQTEQCTDDKIGASLRIRSHLRRLGDKRLPNKQKHPDYIEVLVDCARDTFLNLNEESEMKKWRKIVLPPALKADVKYTWDHDLYDEMYVIADKLEEEQVPLPSFFLDHLRNDRVHTSNCKVLRALLNR